MKPELKRVLEMAYLYAWGAESTSKLRDEWRRLYDVLSPTESLEYMGQRTFTWHPRE
jgi:hypothetical protein